ncbi:Hypothetical_protein [Hexamita inflata]|uniref:Hypothetical_protein n=1 Tax=Hexamita inflata TaxID=28002 RepID=A0ABP1KJD5_9EUKA
MQNIRVIWLQHNENRQIISILLLPRFNELIDGAIFYPPHADLSDYFEIVVLADRSTMKLVSKTQQELVIFNQNPIQTIFYPSQAYFYVIEELQIHRYQVECVQTTENGYQLQIGTYYGNLSFIQLYQYVLFINVVTLMFNFLNNRLVLFQQVDNLLKRIINVLNKCSTPSFINEVDQKQKEPAATTKVRTERESRTCSVQISAVDTQILTVTYESLVHEVSKKYKKAKAKLREQNQQQ